MDAAEQTAPRPSLLLAEPGRREGLILGIALALLAALPFVVATLPQMTDYPSHLARWHVMLDQGRSPFLAQYYAFEWRLTGNLGADLLIWPLAKLFGLEAAGRMLGAVIIVLTGAGLLAVEWTLRGRIGAGTLLAFAMIWSPAMAMGFYNFTLALALALLGFALWVRMERSSRRWLVFLPLALIVWLSHTSGWGVLGVLVFGYEWHRQRGLGAFIAPWPLTLPLVPLLLAGGTKGGLSFGKDVAQYKFAIWLQGLRDQVFQLDVLSLLVVLALLLMALRRKRIDGRLGWAALILGGLTIAMPRHFGGGDFADLRLVAVALMIGALAIDWSPPRWLLWLAPGLFLVRLFVTSTTWQAQSHELETMLQALDHVPQGARVASAVLVDTRNWALNPYEHVGSYATLRRDALVNSHFAIPGIHMLRLRQGGKDFLDPSQRIFAASGKPIDLAQFEPAGRADYLWYIGAQQPSRLPTGSRVIYRTNGSLLARLVKPEASR